jgi:CRISPR-associated protein Cas2
MWMLVMFDLPVVRDKERKEATRFRQDLLELSFDMAQYSVYMRCCVSRERTDALVGHVRTALPSGGKVAILIFTDKQYENMLHFYAREEINAPPDNGQLALF